MVQKPSLIPWMHFKQSELDESREANNLGSSCLLIAFFDSLHLNGLLGPHARLTRLPSCFENGGVLGRIPSTRVKFPFGGLKTNSLYVYF